MTNPPDKPNINLEGPAIVRAEMHPLSPMSRTIKVLALSLGQGLTALIGLLSAVVLSRVLDKVEYATFRQTFLAYEFAAPVMGLGIAQAIYYFLPGETERVRGRVMDALSITVFMGCLFSLFILLGGNQLLSKRFNNPQLADALIFLSPYPVFMMAMGLLASVLVVRERVKLLSTFNVLSRFAIGLAVIVPCLFWKEAKVSIIGQVVMTIMVSSIAIYLMIRETPIGSYKPKWESMRSMVRYSVPLGIASMVGTISMQLDKVIVSSMCSSADFAVYANGAIEIPLIGIVTGSISLVILGDMRKLILEGNNDEAIILFRRAAEKAAWILLPAMMFLLINADSFIKVLFSEKYADSVLPFRIYLLLLPVRIVFYSSVLMAIGKTKVILYRTLTGFGLNFMLAVLLVNAIGYIGAVMASIIVVYLWSVPFNLYHITRHFKTKVSRIIPFKIIGKILIYTALPSFLIVLIEFFYPIKVPITQLLFNTIFFGSIMLFFLNGPIYKASAIKKWMKKISKGLI
jgi:O-antigen/teichoic acid export membrane protein